MVCLSTYGWYILSWSFYIRHKVKSNTCYLFSPLFLFLCLIKVAKNFTFTSETSVILLLIEHLSSNPTEKILGKIVEDELEEAFSDGIRKYVQWEHIILLSVPFSQQLPRIKSLLILVFSKYGWKVIALFVENTQVLLNSESLLIAGIYLLASNKLQSILHAIFTLVNYPLIFVASVECLNSATLTCENRYCTTFKLRRKIRSD